MTPIRTLHFADLHLGVETHGRVDPATGQNSRIVDFLHGLDQIVAAAQVQKCDLVIFAGDAFKNPRPSPTVFRQFSERIKTLSERHTVLLLVGNHDAPKSPHLASSLDVFQALDIPNVIVGNTPGSQVLSAASGDYFLSWMPFPFRERLMAKAEYADATIEEIDEIHRVKVHEILKHKAREAAAKSMPSILAGHFGVVGADPGASTAYFGHDVLIEAEALAEGWDYVALGHYHGFQQLHDYPPVIYSGSPDRISFNEEHEVKGYVLADVGYTPDEKTVTEFVELDTRPFVTLEQDLRHRSDATASLVEYLDDAVLEGAIVRIKVQINAEQSLNDQAIVDALPSVASLSIIKESDDRVRLRLDESQVSTMTPGELVDAYFERKGLDKDRRQPLTRSAKEIIDEANRSET